MKLCWCWSSNNLATWCEEPTHWKRPWCLERLRAGAEWGWQSTRWLYGITDSMDMSLSKFWEMVKEREAWWAADHGVKKSRTWQSDWKTTFVAYEIMLIDIISNSSAILLQSFHFLLSISCMLQFFWILLNIPSHFTVFYLHGLFYLLPWLKPFPIY